MEACQDLVMKPADNMWGDSKTLQPGRLKISVSKQYVDRYTLELNANYPSTKRLKDAFYGKSCSSSDLDGQLQ